MMSKKKILKGMDQQIANQRFGITEIQITDESLMDKTICLQKMRQDLDELIQTRKRLEALLI